MGPQNDISTDDVAKRKVSKAHAGTDSRHNNSTQAIYRRRINCRNYSVSHEMEMIVRK
jgi:hypothetical protein